MYKLIICSYLRIVIHYNFLLFTIVHNSLIFNKKYKGY